MRRAMSSKFLGEGMRGRLTGRGAREFFDKSAFLGFRSDETPGRKLALCLSCPAPLHSWSTTWRRHATACGSPWFSRVVSNSAAVFGGLRRFSLWRLMAAQTTPGSRSRRPRRKSSGCCAWISKRASVSAGKSVRLQVTIVSAPARIAAARTCRSSGSGNSPSRVPGLRR